MPTLQTINPEENRLFNSSIGDWTGAMTWESGPYYGKSGLAKIERNISSDPDSMELSYPRVSALRNRFVSFGMWVGWFTGSNTFFSKVTISDGISSFENEKFVSSAERWVSHTGSFFLPVGWIKNQTTMKLTIRPFVGYPIIAVYDVISLWAHIYRTDHLPSLGAG